MPPAIAASQKNSDSIYFAQWFLKNEYRKLYSDKFHIIPCDIKFYISLFRKCKKLLRKTVLQKNKKITFE